MQDKQVKANTPEGVVLKWLKELSHVRDSNEQERFERNGERIVKEYRNASSLNDTGTSNLPASRVMYNVLWSNVQIQKPLLYARTPKPVVQRRHKDADPIGRLACKIAERAASFHISSQEDRFNYVMDAAVEDRLLPGRGVAWVRYDADFGTNSDTDKTSGNELGEGYEKTETLEQEEAEGTEDAAESTAAPEQVMPNSERVIFDYVHWCDFFHSPARNWYEVRWVARRSYMNRKELCQRFGEVGHKVELTASPTQKRKKKLTEDEAELVLQAEIFEIWDLSTKMVTWVSEGYKEAPLDQVPDPLKLEGFWPCPMPLMATTTTDTLYPTPDYKIYERLASELDYVTKRISSLVECVRVIGMHASALGDDLKSMLRLPDGQTWPVKQWAQFMQEKGGLAGAINWFPFDQAVNALGPLWQHQQNLITQIDALTGIPDIVRGGTDPNETAAAVQRKSKWTMLKAAKKQADVQRFCKELISKATQITFEPGLFSDETIALMVNAYEFPEDEQAQYPEALALLRDDRLRTFKVDIETDSTIATDEDEEQARRMEYLGTMSNLIQSIQGISEYRPELMQPVVQSALFAARAFRTGRELEGAWERAMQQIEDADAQAKQNPQPPPPDPAMMAAQNDAQRVQNEQMKLGQDAQIKQAEMQQEFQLKSQELQFESWKLSQEIELKGQELQIKAQDVMGKQEAARMDQELKQFKEQFVQYTEQQRLELEKYATVLNEREKLIEENRLARDTQLETVRLLADAQKTSASEAKAPIVNVHIPAPKARVSKVVRGMTGQIEGAEHRDIDE
jgi:hypothetical protein